MRDMQKIGKRFGLRKLLRRQLLGPPFSRGGVGRYPVDDLLGIDRGAAYEFRPALREDVTVEPNLVKRGSVQVQLDEFESAVLSRCQGTMCAGEIAILVANELPRWSSETALTRTLEFLSKLGGYDMLVTGEQTW